MEIRVRARCLRIHISSTGRLTRLSCTGSIEDDETNKLVVEGTCVGLPGGEPVENMEACLSPDHACGFAWDREMKVMLQSWAKKLPWQRRRGCHMLIWKNPLLAGRILRT